MKGHALSVKTDETVIFRPSSFCSKGTKSPKVPSDARIFEIEIISKERLLIRLVFELFDYKMPVVSYLRDRRSREQIIRGLFCPDGS